MPNSSRKKAKPNPKPSPKLLPPLRVKWSGIEGQLHSLPPLFDGEAVPGKWRREGTRVRPHLLGGCAGTVREEIFAAAGLRVTRSVWQPDKGEALAVRLQVENTGRKTRALRQLTPAIFDGPGSLRLGSRPAGDWTVVLQKREKNEVPEAHRLGVFGLHETVDEIGEVVEQRETGPLHLAGDQFALLRSGNGQREVCLLAGYLSQQDALGTLRVETDEARRDLAALRLDCEMDGVVLPVGGMRQSEWVVLLGGRDGGQLVDDFARRVAAYHHVAEPAANPPAVWCSWYVYGNEFGEKEFRTELGAMQRARVPFDVFLIDDFRPRAWGDWFDAKCWPAGLKDAADRIRAAGYRPGFWTCPYVIERGSKFAKAHPEWMLRRRDGEHVLFKGQSKAPRPRTDPQDPEGEPLFTVQYDHFYVLDPTHPGAAEYLEDLYRRLTDDYGFTYHKFDFMRAVFGDAEAVFFDRGATRLQAYRRGLEAIRRGAGPSAYLAVCGGHYGGSMGLADAQRSGADVRSRWDRPPVLPKVRQNLLRSWMNAFWHTDADALMVRYQPRPLKRTFGGRHTIGLLNLDEARTMTANQYAGGGMLCGSEPMAVITPERLALYRHVIPALRAPGVPLDMCHPDAPTRMLNVISPRGAGLEPWLTVTVFNWTAAPVEECLVLDRTITGRLPAARYLATEFFTGECAGVVGAGYVLGRGMVIPPHGCRIWRLAPWDGRRPVLAGTDRHFSGGGVEIAAWRADRNRVEVQVESPWPGPMRVAIAYRCGRGIQLIHRSVLPGDSFKVVARSGR